MNPGLEFWIAGRYLRARREEGFISVVAGFSLVGIALGVATLIVVMSVMNGFHTQLVDRIVGVNGHVIVHPAPGERAFPDPDALAARLLAAPGVVDAFPEVEAQAMATAPDGATGVIVRGMRPDDLLRRELVADNVAAGSLDDVRDGAAALGARLARLLGVTVGDEVTLLHPDGAETAFGTIPRVRTFRVAATFEVGMYEYDAGLLFLPLDDAAHFFRTGGGATQIELFLDDADAAEEASRELGEVLGDEGRAVAWPRLNPQFFNALEVERNVMFLILTLIILVAVFNVISSLIMLVGDKRRGIAILRTMGATRASMMRVFVLTGGFVGVAGTLAGFLLGLGFALNIESIRQAIERLSGAELFAAEVYFLSQLPAEVRSTQVALVVVTALVLSLLATLYPSWRASRVDPAEALRHE